MKRHLLFCGLFAGGLVLAGGLRAQDAATAAARAQAEDFYRTTNQKISDLEETLQSHQKRMNNLREENGKLREEIDRLKNKGESTATQEAIKNLQDGINEVERNRKSDNEKTLKALRELEKLILERPSRTPPKDPATTARPGTDLGKPVPDARLPGGREVGWEYAIQEKDTLSGIVAKLRTRDDLKKLTQKQVKDANPGVNWDKLKINQKIFIPAPQ